MRSEEILSYIIPLIGFTLMVAGWMGVQILAKKMKTKNHIDNTSGCCGACENKASCSKA